MQFSRRAFSVQSLDAKSTSLMWFMRTKYSMRTEARTSAITHQWAEENKTLLDSLVVPLDRKDRTLDAIIASEIARRHKIEFTVATRVTKANASSNFGADILDMRPDLWVITGESAEDVLHFLDVNAYPVHELGRVDVSIAVCEPPAILRTRSGRLGDIHTPPTDRRSRPPF